MNFKQIIILMTLLFVGISHGQMKTFIDQPFVETTAQVDSLVVPDRIFLSITLDESDTKNRVSVEAQENKMVSVLKKLGIDTDEQLVLADLATNFQDYFLRKKGVVKSKSFELLVYDALSAGEVVQSLEAEGISNVYFLRAELSKMEELKLLMRTKAVEQAIRQAEALLQPFQQKPGRVLHIADLNIGITENWRASNMRMAVQSAEQAPIDVDFKKIKLSCSLSAKFAIE